MKYPKLGTPRKLLEHGHTLQIYQYPEGWIGCLGHVLYEGIYIMRGPSIDEMSLPSGPSLPGFRTATSVKVDGQIYLFCASKRDTDDDGGPWQHQKINCFMFSDVLRSPYDLSPSIQGSAPFIFRDEKGWFHLYYHSQQQNEHLIYHRQGKTILGLFVGMDTVLLAREHTFSVPSVIKYGDVYWLTCEEKVDEAWRTVLFSGTSPVGPFKLCDDHLLDGPCAYQHVFDGRIAITYSRKEGDHWQVWMVEEE